MIRMLVLTIVPVAVLLGAMSWLLIPLAFGADFEPAVLPFVLLLPGTVCLTIWYAVGLFIVAALHRPGTTTVIQGSALLIALPLYWFAVGEWGMTGAAIVSSATYCSVLAAGVSIFLRHRSSPTARLVPGAQDVRELVALARTALARSTWRARHA
jgi:O-antigen/teichoic acid export membrane protein